MIGGVEGLGGVPLSVAMGLWAEVATSPAGTFGSAASSSSPLRGSHGGYGPGGGGSPQHAAGSGPEGVHSEGGGTEVSGGEGADPHGLALVALAKPFCVAFNSNGCEWHSCVESLEAAGESLAGLWNRRVEQNGEKDARKPHLHTHL